MLLLQLTVVMFGLRYFWGVENIRRFVTEARAGTKNVVMAAMLAFSVGVLLGQALLIYFLARIHKGLVTEMAVGETASDLAICGLGVLGFNAIWLTILQFYTSKRSPEWIWVLNNSVFVAIVCGIWVWSDDSYWSITLIGGALVLNSIVDYAFSWKHYSGLSDSDN